MALPEPTAMTNANIQTMVMAARNNAYVPRRVAILYMATQKENPVSS